MPCYKTCKSCKEKGDIYDHKCTQCKRGYKFEDDSNIACIIDPNQICNISLLVSEASPLSSMHVLKAKVCTSCKSF